jgi:protocatechuate 3,4-dioxygenase beta subunit
MTRMAHRIPMDRRSWLRLVGRASAGIALVGCGGGLADDDPLDAAPGDAPLLPDGAECAPTTADVLGPFYRDGAPSRMELAALTEPGDRLALDGIVYSDDCATPLVGAVLDVWQADATGAYHEPNAAGGPYRLRGKVTTADDGTWSLSTIRPGNYENGPGGWRPAHIHFTVSHFGYRTVTTQLYFAGDPFLPPNDSCTACGSDDPLRVIALAASKNGLAGSWPVVLART